MGIIDVVNYANAAKCSLQGLWWLSSAGFSITAPACPPRGPGRQQLCKQPQIPAPSWVFPYWTTQTVCPISIVAPSILASPLLPITNAQIFRSVKLRVLLPSGGKSLHWVCIASVSKGTCFTQDLCQHSLSARSISPKKQSKPEKSCRRPFSDPVLPL